MRYLKLIIVDTLLHLQCILDIEIDEFTVLVTNDTIGLAFQHDVYCVSTHDRCIVTILSSRASSTLHVT